MKKFDRKSVNSTTLGGPFEKFLCYAQLDNPVFWQIQDARKNILSNLSDKQNKKDIFFS